MLRSWRRAWECPGGSGAGGDFWVVSYVDLCLQDSHEWFYSLSESKAASQALYLGLLRTGEIYSEPKSSKITI